MMKLISARTAGFALIALICGGVAYQILMVAGGAVRGVQLDTQPTSMLCISSAAASLFGLLMVLVILEKLGIVHLLKRNRLINAILWSSAVFMLFSAVMNTVVNLSSPGDKEWFMLTLLACVASGLFTIVARAPSGEDH